MLVLFLVAPLARKESAHVCKETKKVRVPAPYHGVVDVFLLFVFLRFVPKVFSSGNPNTLLEYWFFFSNLATSDNFIEKLLPCKFRLRFTSKGGGGNLILTSDFFNGVVKCVYAMQKSSPFSMFRIACQPFSTVGMSIQVPAREICASRKVYV